MRFLIVLLAGSVCAQTPLTIQEAARAALRRHPSTEAARLRSDAAGARVEQARAGWLPKINYTESWQRSNNPVFVFSSLLTQRQFGAANFEVGRLNRPDFLNQFQSVLSVEQTVFDGRQVTGAVRSAELAKVMADEDKRAAEMNAIAAAARAYYGLQWAEANVAAARQARQSAEADLERAKAIFEAGRSTEADLLTVQVYLAASREQEIRRTREREVAEAALAEALGEGFGQKFVLQTPLTAPVADGRAIEAFETRALSERPEVRQAALSIRVAESQGAMARGSLLPQVGVRAQFEADRQEFVNKGGTNWFVGASLRWNLFNGYSDRARIAEASHALAAARKQEEQLRRAVGLDIRRAWAELQSARERIEVSSATIRQAEESLRITQDRYANGLSTVTDLLRSETALAEARTRRLGALYDARIAALALELAAGTLTGDSDVLR
ncbi:MAG: TolC family protein [Bryobacteraceae bacterium]|nr:TolC family protein [Bryobacteraceae bacterium]